MNAAEVLALALPSVVSGIGLYAIKGAFASRTSQGERLGKLESARDIEIGRRQGFAEGYEAAQRAARAEPSNAR